MKIDPSSSVSAYLNRQFRTRAFRHGDVAGVAFVMVVVSVVMGILELGGDPLRHAWALERGAVLDGQVWRLVTAHLVNLSRTHTVLNILGLALVTASISSGLSPMGLLRSILFSGAAISFGWLLLQPDGSTYVGFSGITHGIYAFGALVLLQRGPRWLGWLVLFALALKLGQEFFNGSVPGADAEIGGLVSLQAHALGTFGGALAAWRRGPVAPWIALVLVSVFLSISHADPHLPIPSGFAPAGTGPIR